MLAGNEQLMQVGGSVASRVGASVPVKHRVIREMLLTADLERLVLGIATFLFRAYMRLPLTEDLRASRP